MPVGFFHRARVAAVRPEHVRPDAAALSRLFVVSVPTDLLLACAWTAVGLIASISLAVAVPLADPLATLLALG